MEQSERTRRYRTRGSGADLVRVEVLVPPDDRQTILDAALRLRAEARKPLSSDLLALRTEALDRFGTRCFWNSAPPPTAAGLMAVCDRLQTYGDMAAWRLAARIRKGIERADR